MLKSVIVLPDGTRLSSGPNETNPIMSVTLTEEVNAGDELALGSACAAILEANILAPYGGLTLAAGDKVTLYKVDEAGVEHKKGVFILEKPSRVSANAVKLTGYDRMIELDKDLTTWLNELDEWPYSLHDFADMVCNACGLSLVTEEIPNADFPAPQFKYPDVTGRQLMKWIGEICGCFCRANADGNVELAWYASSGKTITPSGDYRYFAKGLSYETYQVAPIEAVQIKLADNEDGALWPAADEDTNSYVISGNPILLADVSDELEPYLDVIRQRLAALRYTPCKVSLPANLAINAGSTVEIIDSNGDSLSACVMRKISTGQQDKLECSGSRRRDSSPAKNNQSAEGKVRELQIALKDIDGDKIIAMINLSDEGAKIAAENIKLEGTVTANSNFKILADGSMETIAGKIAGWTIDDNSIRHGNLGASGSMWLCRTGTSVSPSTYGNGGIGDTAANQTGWCITVGNKFGVLSSGACYASDLHVTGGTVKIKIDHDGTEGYVTVNSAGLLVTSVDYKEGESGSAMKYGTNSIQYEEEGSSVPMIQVGYYEDTGEFEKVLLGRWVIEDISSPTITALERRIAALESVVGD